ncbi:MAG: hypothetical protein ACYC27_21930 [Armatimonadota bacterium]
MNNEQIGPFSNLYDAIKQEFNNLNLRIGSKSFKVNSKTHHDFLRVPLGIGYIHYEWRMTINLNRLDIALHFESTEKLENMKWLKILTPYKDIIIADSDVEFDIVPYGTHKDNGAVMFRIPYDCDSYNPENARRAVLLMKDLIKKTWPIIEANIN